MRQLDRAMEDFVAAEKADVTRGDSSRLHIGAVQWLQGLETEAVQTWEGVVRDLDSGDIVYTDAAGGVVGPALLWFAAQGLIRRNFARPQLSH